MEVELKLDIPPLIPGGAEQVFSQLVAQERLAGYPLGPARQVAMRDVYYDTRQYALAGAGAGLRLRVANGAALVTLKVNRLQEGALARREEWEEPLSAEALRRLLARVQPWIGSGEISLEAFAAGREAGSLLPVLVIETQRLARPVGDVAILTLDRVIYPGRAETPFYDLEVEATSAPGAEEALRRIEAELQRINGGWLIPATVSKLERGLLLPILPS